MVVLKMISVRWRPSDWMKFSSLFFFLNRPCHGPTTDDRPDEFPDGWLPSNHSRYGVCERKHTISNTPKEKVTRWKIGRARGPRHVFETGNEVPGNMFRTVGIDWCAVCAVAPSCWNHTLAQSPPPAYLLSTTHSRDVRFPWITVYDRTEYILIHC